MKIVHSLFFLQYLIGLGAINVGSHYRCCTKMVWIYFLETWLFHLKHTNKRNCISTHLNSKRLWKIHKKPVEIWNNCCCCLSNYRRKTERQTGEQKELCLRFSVTPCIWYNSLVTPLYSHGPWRQGVPVCGNRVVRMIETERWGGEDIFRRLDLQIEEEDTAGMPWEIVQWHSTLSTYWHCFCPINVSWNHSAEVHLRLSLSLLKWVTFVWADFPLERSCRLHSGPRTFHFTDQWLLTRKFTLKYSLHAHFRLRSSSQTVKPKGR